MVGPSGHGSGVSGLNAACAWIIAFVLGLATPAPAHAAPRVFSLDACADQYVLAMTPRAQIAGLSTRALRADAPMRDAATGLPLRRADLESVLTAKPDIVLRVWGGWDLVEALDSKGIRVVTLSDAHDFDAIAANIRRAGAALDNPAAAERLVASMRSKLSARERNPVTALYLTPSATTAGPGTLPDAVMAQAGVSNATTRPGWGSIPLEVLVKNPPKAYITGFMDTARGYSDPGRHTVVKNQQRRARTVDLPGRTLACPSWFAADAVQHIRAGL